MIKSKKCSRSDGGDFEAASSWENYLKELKINFYQSYYSNVRYDFSIYDFHYVQTVRMGSFSSLIISQMKKDGKMFLIDIRKKEEIVGARLVRNILQEKRILQGLKFPMCNPLIYAFQDYSFIYFCFPLVNGGSIGTHLGELGKFDEAIGCFISAQITLALEYLHYLGLVFRNITSEILLDHRGYIKIQGFYFCKKITDRTYTLCGMLEYLAPEMLLNSGYGKSVDWWALGVLLFLMSTGKLPFVGEDPFVVYDQISAGNISVPSELSDNLRSIIGCLLESDLSKRCGSALYSGPAKFVKSHPFYKSIDWVKILKQTSPAPFIPYVSGPHDFSFFNNLKDISLQSPDDKLADFSEYFSDF